MEQDEFERQELIQLLREGEIERFNDRRTAHKLKRVDLSGSDLVFIDLSRALLVEADLADSSLSGAIMNGTNLRGAFLSGCDLTGAELRKADLTGADLTGAELAGAVMVEATLQSANLHGVSLGGADLSGANLRDADLHGADLRNAIFTGSDVLGVNLEGIRANPEDFERLGIAGEEGGDRSVKAGRFEIALRFYDQADKVLQSSHAFARRVDLFRKMARLSAALGLEKDDLRTRARHLYLTLLKSRNDATDDGAPERAADAGTIAENLRQEMGFTDDPTASQKPDDTADLTRTDISRHGQVAFRMFRKYDIAMLMTRLGELVDLMDDSTALDVTLRFHVPDLKLEKRPASVDETPADLDRLRGEGLMEILEARLRTTICQDSGDVHRAWLKGDLFAMEALCSLFHREMGLPSPYRIIAALIATIFVKGSLAKFCGWQPGDLKSALGTAND